MPPLTRWYIKTALVYFILALASGVLMAAQQAGVRVLPAIGLYPVYIHLLVEGWITSLIIGVAFWMFPVLTHDHPRGSVSLGWSSYLLLNAGLVLRIIAEPANALAAAPHYWGILLAAAALLQWAGGMAFIANTWARVKGR